MLDTEIQNLHAKIQKIMICHSQVDNVLMLADRCYSGAREGGDSRGLLIIGESGTGKSRILKHISETYPTDRRIEGLYVPVVLAEIPSNPTVKGLASTILHKLGDPLFDKGSETAMTIRLKVLLQAAGTRVLLIDEFQQFVDRASKKVQHHVADWLKNLVESTKISLVVAGLPYGTKVIESNQQLSRRFRAPVEMPRFDWKHREDREEFMTVLSGLQEMIPELDFPDLSADEMAFRVYCATGGLIGRVANLFLEVVDLVDMAGSKSVTMEILNKASKGASYDMAMGIHNPFSREFDPTPTSALINAAMKIGMQFDEVCHDDNDAGRKKRKGVVRTALSVLSAKVGKLNE